MKSKHNMVYNLQNFMRSQKSDSALSGDSTKSASAFDISLVVMRVLSVVLVSVFLTACAMQPTGQVKSDESVVAERAQARLDALLAGSLPQAWSYATPGYRQRVTNPMHYSAVVGGSGSWRAAVVDRVTCDSDEVCNVRVLITYPLLTGAENTKPLNERWIKVDGEWWIFHRR